VGVYQLAALDNGNRSGGNAGLLKNLGGDAIDAGAENGVDVVDCLRGCLGMGGRERQARDCEQNCWADEPLNEFHRTFLPATSFA